MFVENELKSCIRGAYLTMTRVDESFSVASSCNEEWLA